MSIFTFPPELKVHLFKSFTLYQLLQMRLVSRQWKAMMETVGSFKRELRIVSQYTETNTAFNSVKLSNRRFDPEPPLISPDGAHFLSTIFPNITKATFDLNQAEYSQPNCFNFDILLQWAPNLTYLNFNLHCLEFGSASVNIKCAQLFVIISTLPALTQLHLTNMKTHRHPNPFPVLSGLEELKLKHNGYFDIEYLEVALRQVGPSLTSLAIENIPDVLPESTITKLSSSLTHLVIYQVEVHNSSFFATLRRLHGLTVLDLCAVSYFNELHFPDLMVILVDLPQLHTVSLNTCLLSYKTDPPYSFPAHPAVRQLYIKSDEKLVSEMLKLPSFAYAFPNVNKVTVAAHDVHQRRRFLRIDDGHYQTLENYVKGHFGEQIVVELEDTGHWNSDEEDDEDEEDVLLDYNFSTDDDFDGLDLGEIDYTDYWEWEDRQARG